MVPAPWRAAMCARSPGDQCALFPRVERAERAAVGQMLLKELAQKPLVRPGGPGIALSQPPALRPFPYRPPRVQRQSPPARIESRATLAQHPPGRVAERQVAGDIDEGVTGRTAVDRGREPELRHQVPRSRECRLRGFLILRSG